MTTNPAVAPTRPTYGNWIAQRSPGILGAGLIGTVVLLAGLVFTMLGLVALGWRAAFVLAVVFALAFTGTGTPAGRILGRRVAYVRARRRGEHQWRSGMFTLNKKPSNRLPGMLGKTTLLSKDDAFGQPFAVIKNPRLGGLYTVVARCTAEGPSMQDRERIDGWVAGYSRVLASCGQERAVICAKAITDTAPDPGGRLHAMVGALRDPSGPPLARQIMDECVADYPAASSENTTYLELTFRGRLLNRKGDEAAILSELARRVPGLLGQVQDAGGGSVDMVTTADLPKIVRAGYDPAAQPLLEQADLSGAHETVTWEEAGPVAYQDLWDRFIHDSGHSVTWEMFAPPRAPITETALGALLMPHRDFIRKRVALVYRPHSPDESVTISERDANTATFSAKQSKKRVSAVASLAMDATDKSRREVASGAAMVRFSLLVTGTVNTDDQMPQAASTIDARAGAVPVRLRRSYGSQAAAFAATLPVGFVPWEHTVVPDKVREWM